MTANSPPRNRYKSQGSLSKSAGYKLISKHSQGKTGGEDEQMVRKHIISPPCDQKTGQCVAGNVDSGKMQQVLNRTDYGKQSTGNKEKDTNDCGREGVTSAYEGTGNKKFPTDKPVSPNQLHSPPVMKQAEKLGTKRYSGSRRTVLTAYSSPTNVAWNQVLKQGLRGHVKSKATSKIHSNDQSRFRSEIQGVESPNEAQSTFGMASQTSKPTPETKSVKCSSTSPVEESLFDKPAAVSMATQTVSLMPQSMMGMPLKHYLEVLVVQQCLLADKILELKENLHSVINKMETSRSRHCFRDPKTGMADAKSTENIMGNTNSVRQGNSIRQRQCNSLYSNTGSYTSSDESFDESASRCCHRHSDKHDQPTSSEIKGSKGSKGQQSSYDFKSELPYDISSEDESESDLCY